ncbi:MAG: adenylosuccinate lyase [Candidatus Diapherotrites archaeon]|nr:adenylosuccinate lyase [Candidatus Diapherotrites archaeon]
MNKFDCISPLDYRYGSEKFTKFLSEEARIRYQARVEAALAKALAKRGVCSEKDAAEIGAACERVTAEEVYAEEERIKHDVRALANCIRAKVSEKAKPFVHFGATSYDIVDTASALRYKEATEQVVLPALLELERAWIEIALREKNTLQIGRTHGQHAEPITFGFAMAEFVNRLGNRIKAIESAKNSLEGKFSGAVGAYNATSMIIPDPLALEKEIMRELGLKPAMHSTQIVPPESLQDLLHALTSAFCVLANFSDDMRNLQRTEIAEVAEQFGEKQVGSSTMPHKRNPINFENVKSLWKQFMPRMQTVYLDSISEHQRDLTNSASARFLPEVFAGLATSAERLAKVCKKLVVDEKNMRTNFEKTKGSIAAEPLYIILAMHGHPDAHEAVRQLTLEAEKTGKPLGEALEESEEMQPYIEKLSVSQRTLLNHPEIYTGKAAEKTEQVCLHWKKELLL